jgi:hypothetical protein
MTALRFRVNRSFVAHEIQENRAILVHIGSGAYYALEPLATIVWTKICDTEGLVVPGKISACPPLLNFSRLRREVGVGWLLEYLYQEELITCEEVDPDAANVLLTDPSELENGAWPDQPAQIHKHQEMELFLRLDPILVSDSDSLETAAGE